MSLEPAFAEAADRHYHDGTLLLTQQRYDNAGYHFGLAVECAIKAALWERGERFERRSKYKEHIPKLMRIIREERLLPQSITSLVGNDSFMERWDIFMRYAADGAIPPSAAEAWRHDAENLLEEINNV